MRALILGGTGAMGIHLVEILSKSGVDTFVTTRKKIKSKKNLTYINGDAKNSSFLEKVLTQKWDVIVDFMVYKTNELEERIQLLLNATKQYFFLSSARVYSDSQQPITENSYRLLDISEDKYFLSTDEYSLSKARQENILFNSKLNNWTIIRPYITYSENRLQLGVLEKEEWLFRALRGRTIVFSKDMIDKITTMTYGLDVSKGILALIGKQEALSKTFHITSNESYTWEEILKKYVTIIEKILGFTPKILLLNMDDFLDIHPGKYQIKYDRLFNRKFDNSEVNNFLDTKTFLSIDNGLEKCLSEFIRKPIFKNINWKSEALKDKHANEKTSLCEIIGIKQKIKYILFRYLPIQIIYLLKKSKS